MAQDIICRPWKGIKGPWVCLMSTLYLFCYVFTLFFLNFLTSKRQVENKVVGKGTRTAGSCSVSVTLFCKVELWQWQSLSHVPGILQARVLEWVAVPFPRGSSQPRDWTHVSHIAGRFLTSWATREGLKLMSRQTQTWNVNLWTSKQ